MPTAELVTGTIWEAAAEQLDEGHAGGGASGPLRWVLTDVDYEGFNGVHDPAPVGDVDALRGLVAAAMVPFEAAGRSMLWHFDPAAADPALPEVLTCQGLTHYETEPGMVADLRTSPRLDRGTDLELVPVPLDVDGFTTWAQVWSGERGTEMVARTARLRLARATARQRPTRHLLGLSEGQPVCCAAVYLGARAALVEHVVTSEAVRGRGYGTAITQAALDIARGARLAHAVLTSSPDGVGVYGRLGFRQVNEVTRYLWTSA